MMVPSSKQLQSGKWACDLTAHWSLLLRRDDLGDSLGVLRAWQVEQDGRRPTCWRMEVFFPIARSKETVWYSITADWFAKNSITADL